MIGYLAAGLLAGFSVGFVGAGAAVIGLPFFLYVDRMAPASALGTNALGVAFTAGAVLLYRLARGQVAVRAGLSFALPGLVGVSVGALLGRLVPTSRIVFLLGFLLFAVAGWMFYLSGRMKEGETTPMPVGGPATRDLARLGACGGLVGAVCGFFAIGGGFMIIPAIMLVAGFPLLDAIATGLLPFTVFSLWIGGGHLVRGSALLFPALAMTCTGVLGGLGGIWLSRHLSNVTMQRVFGALMLGLGLYIVLG